MDHFRLQSKKNTKNISFVLTTGPPIFSGLISNKGCALNPVTTFRTCDSLSGHGYLKALYTQARWQKVG